MRVIEPKRRVFKPRKRRNNRFIRVFSACLVLVLVLTAGTSVYLYTRPLSPIGASVKTLTINPQMVSVTWPTIGQAAIGAVGYGLLDQHSDDMPRPMASVNKVLTALVILDKKPLALNSTGPNITLTEDDVALYNTYIEQGGSVVRVAVGEQLSEYQALQALLLPSANNIADTLAIWAYGSIDEYLVAANNYAAKLGMTNTKIADSNGLSPNSVSTVKDFIRLGDTALQNELMANIVSQPAANIPVQGLIQNVNALLGTNGINGIKTGNTDEAGGCFLGSALVTAANGRKVTVLVAVMAAKDLGTALRSSLQIFESAQKGFGETKLFAAGTVVGQYLSPWQGQIPAVLQKDVTSFGWLATPLSPSVILNPVKVPLSSKSKVGYLKISGSPKLIQSDVVISAKVELPSTKWRISNMIDRIKNLKQDYSDM